MAAYAYTAALDMPHAEKLGVNSRVGILTGTVDVTNYNTTNAAIAEINSVFSTLLDVQLSISHTGHFGEWTGTSIKVWEATGDAGVAEEADVDDDAGIFKFVAFGII